MSLYKIADDKLSEIPSVNFKKINYLEKHLQDLIKDNPSVLGEELLIISEEYTEWQESKKRLDLLALDRSGNLVVIEIKRDNDGFHMDLQAIRYAAMLSLMTYDNAINTYSHYLEKLGEDNSIAKKTINEFLIYNEDDTFEFAKDIRIILVNNSYSKELTSSVLWLRAKGIDIKCILVSPYRNEEDNTVFLDIDVLIPLKEANEYMVALEKREQDKAKVSQEVKNSRDRSKFIFNGEKLSKNRLVLKVVRQYVEDHANNIDIEKLKKVFPDELQGSTGVVKTLEEYRNENRIGKRFFDDENEIITLPDSTQIVVCTQWAIGNIYRFIDRAEQLNYTIKKVES